MKILDPRFKYTPAAATDVASTWKRFGFSERANEARREAWRTRFPIATLPRNARTAILVLCTTALAACAAIAPQTSEPRPDGHSPISSPVFVHEPVTGGEVRSDVRVEEIAYSREVDPAHRDCLAMQAIGQRAAASFGSSLRGRGDTCENGMHAIR